MAKGLATGCIEAIICYPTELVKTTLQLQSKTNAQYSGMVDCGAKIFKTNGVRGLYAGAAPLILGSSAKQGARWAAYEAVSKVLTETERGRERGRERSVLGLL